MHIFKTHSERVLKKVKPIVKEILRLDSAMQQMSDEELKGQTEKFRQWIRDGKPVAKILPEAFAVVREASFRTLGMKQYPVQLLSGLMLYNGCISEQKTGEGKTLVCAAPAYLSALSGKPVHVVTVNDYLAKRDADEIGQIHRFLGLTVGCILGEMSQEERRAAYACDITYATNHELGFDYLRDNMAMDESETVMRGLGYAIIDEADSVLIDEARTPLIISGQGGKSTKMYEICDVLAGQLERGTQTEFSATKIFDADEMKETGDYAVDEKEKNIVLTANGIRKVEQFFHIDDLSDPKNLTIHHHVILALRAKELMKRDKDYMVKDGAVQIVDEFTGRVMPDRRYSDGLHQAIEAKEGVQVMEENRTYATITFQNFFNKYEKKSGMTGTAMTEKKEFRDIYGMDVIAIPTNRPVIRVDHEDAVYKTMDEKYRAIIHKIKEVHAKGQPVLVGTTDIKTSETLSAMLKKEGLKHEVLNAKNHELEAEIIAQAGKHGAVTLATNMAGRGTDIKLDDEARAAGGLYVIGTQRHESRRIDNQLSGRSGRQGDPGESKFYISLEDRLMGIFAGKNMMDLFNSMDIEKDEEIGSPLLSKAITNAQKKIESLNFASREQLLKYDTVNCRQREELYEMRNIFLKNSSVEDVLLYYADGFIADTLNGDNHTDMHKICDVLGVRPNADFLADGHKKNTKDLEQELKHLVREHYKKVEVEAGGEEAMQRLVRRTVLRAMNVNWMRHLEAMDKLKEGIGLIAYAQTDPLLEYQKRGAVLFEETQRQIREDVLREALNSRMIRIAC
ncbi:preprotein translocase subunit SecA [Pilosibacter fragilis]|jgi:preprotein translocase subunit SecA|uniref:preprotein translocase subunit SecA n=1 Tax=Pilosibacter fragilis TaxID=3078042 RepID=UPI0031BAA008